MIEGIDPHRAGRPDGDRHRGLHQRRCLDRTERSGAERSRTERSRAECGRAERGAAAKTYKIGYSNGGGVGNGFREEQVCTAKAEALASGQVSELTTIHRNTDAAGQLQDIRDLIAADVDAIVFNPNDPAPSTRPSPRPRPPAS